MTLVYAVLIALMLVGAGISLCIVMSDMNDLEEDDKEDG